MTTYGTVNEDTDSRADVEADPVITGTDHQGVASFDSIFDQALDSIADDAAQEKEWDVEDRPNWRTRHYCYIDPDDLKDMREKSREGNRADRRKGEAGVDLHRFYRAMIRHTNTALLLRINGTYQVFPAADGKPATLDSPEFLKLVQGTKWGKNITTNTEAIDRFLGTGWVSALGDSISKEAGFGRVAEPVNP